MKNKKLSGLLKCPKGLSLLEVIIGMVVISLAIVGLAPLMKMSLEREQISGDIIEISEIAREQLHFYETTDPLPPLPFRATHSGLLDGSCKVIVVIEDHASDSLIPRGVALITVSITWLDELNKSQTSVFTTVRDITDGP